ncbi:MAG: HAD family hydrolase [Oscillospiraceae bacterium]
MKPAPEIFRLAQAAAGGGPCVFVGDSCSQDIAGASACGWQTIWLSRTGEEPTASPTLTARSEQDLLPACRRWRSEERPLSGELSAKQTERLYQICHNLSVSAFRRATSPGRGGFGAHPNGFPYEGKA